MAVVVEDGDMELVLELRFELEAAGRGDVFEVDRDVVGAERAAEIDDLVDVAQIEADDDAVQAHERGVEERLALEDGNDAAGAQVAESQHAAAVGDYEHVLADGGQPPQFAFVLRDLLADACDARGVGEPHVGERRDGVGRDDLQLPADVPLDGAIGEDLHPGTGDGPFDGAGQRAGICAIGLDGDVADAVVRVRADRREIPDDGAGEPDLGRDLGERPCAVGHADAVGDVGLHRVTPRTGPEDTRRETRTEATERASTVIRSRRGIVGADGSEPGRRLVRVGRRPV